MVGLGDEIHCRYRAQQDKGEYFEHRKQCIERKGEKET